MCGIVGLYAKNLNISESLGIHIAAMLMQMGERGPDSAGVALYSNNQAASRITVQDDDPTMLQAIQNTAGV